MASFSATQLLDGQDGYVSLWHGRIDGADREIGEALASWGKTHLQASPMPGSDLFLIEAKRRFFARHYEPFHDRVLGVMDALELPPETPFDASSLWFDVGQFACTAALVPRERCSDGHLRVLRNMDLTVDLSGTTPHPPSSRVLALELRPDTTHASLSMVVFDLMGAMDGINEKGLVVVCNSHRDCNLGTPYVAEPVRHPEPGFDELQVVRYLLDLCADVPEAKEALLSLRTYYSFTPCLYMIADAAGRSAVVEKTRSGNRIVFTETQDEVNAMTNFGRSRFPEDAGLPTRDGPEEGFVYTRYRTVSDALMEGAALTEEDVSAIAARVAFDALPGPEDGNPQAPARTPWTGIYDIDAQTLRVSCYTGDAAGAATRSQPIEFSLSKG